MKSVGLFFVIILSITLVPAACSGQHEFESLRGAYFGQDPPGDDPELFMFGSITTLDVEYCISFLVKGTVCVYGRDDCGVNYTYLKNGRWTIPQKMQINHILGEYKHNTGPDDSTLYFMSPDPTGPEDGKNELNIYKMKWTGSGWTEREILPFPPNTDPYHEIYPSVASDGSVYFHGGQYRNVHDMNDDICRSSYLNGVYQEQERLPEPINTGYGEYDAFVAPGHEYLMFGSNRPGGFGRYDSYICFQKNDGGWTHPVNLGKSLNSISWENRVNVTLDGKYMFFVSGRIHKLLADELAEGKWTSVTGFYWVNTTFIQDLKDLMLNSACAAEIIWAEYEKHGLAVAIDKLAELKNDRAKIYHFLPSELLDLCRRMIENGKVDDSANFYDTLLSTVPDDYRIPRGYGMVCVLHGLPDAGLDVVKEAMSEYPVELMVTFYQLGSELVRKSRTEDALKVMQFNVHEYPGHHLPYFGLAKAYEQGGNIEQAIKSCEKALEIRPDYDAAKNLRERLQETN